MTRFSHENSDVAKCLFSPVIIRENGGGGFLESFVLLIKEQVRLVPAVSPASCLDGDSWTS